MNQLAPLRFTGENTFATAQLRAIPGQLVVLLLLVAWLYSSILLHLVFSGVTMRIFRMDFWFPRLHFLCYGMNERG